MAVRDKIINNPRLRQEIRFLQTGSDTGGRLLEMVSTYQTRSKEPPPHYHPYQAEYFTVLSGEVTVRMGGKLSVLKEGDTFHIPVNTVHSMWNNTDGKTVVHWKVEPAMETEYFLETATGLAQDGKTNADGVPGILQIALMARRYASVFRLARPPFALQRVLFILLTPFAYLFGYRPTYKQYLD